MRALRPRKRARLPLRDPSHELRQPRPIGAKIPRQADARLKLHLARGRLHCLELRGQRPVGTGIHSRQAARLGQRHQELRQAAAPAAIRDVADPRVRPAGRERPDQLQRRAADWPGIGSRHRVLLVRILIEVALLGMLGPRALDVPADVHLSDRHQHGRHCDSARQSQANHCPPRSIWRARTTPAPALRAAGSAKRPKPRRSARSSAPTACPVRPNAPSASAPTSCPPSARLNRDHGQLAAGRCKRVLRMARRPANGSRPDLTRPRASGRMTFDVTDAPSK